MSLRALDWALTRKLDDSTCKFVLVAVANYADQKGVCWPSLGRLARDTSFDRSTIVRALRRLEEMGYLRVERRKRADESYSSNLITLVGKVFLIDEEEALAAEGVVAHSNTPSGPALLGVVAQRDGGSGTAPPLEPLVINHPSKPKRSSLRSDAPSDWPSAAWEWFWAKYPHKIGKADAQKAFAKAAKKSVPWGDFCAGLERYVGKTDDRAWCNPATWLNQERWTDQPALQPVRGGPNGAAPRPTFFDIASGRG